jgi:hypothetical protein
MPNGLFTLKQQVLAIQEGAWPNQKTPAVDYLVVAGGGGGFSGGGGAGGLLTGVVSIATGTSYTVTVGAGGTGGAVQTNGADSVFGSIAATGGGRGAIVSAGTSASGGSGGGGVSGVNNGGSSGIGGQGIASQGNRGGTGFSGSASAAGGGGGAGTVGLNAPTASIAGNGGAGIASDISGTRTTYAGGGGGGASSGSTPGAGGAGGGGAGANTNAASGGANTGGGGGGIYDTSTGGNGGSGVVIISYPDVYAAPTATTGSPTVSTSGSGSILEVSASTGLRYAGQAPFVFGTGDFTIELWVYPTSFATFPTFIDMRDPGGTGGGPNFYCMNNGELRFASSNVDRIVSGAAVLSLNTWAHIALCRIGTSTKMYLNGTQVGSTYTDTTNYPCSSTGPRVLKNCNEDSGAVVGNTTNFRIVKGVGVYTGNFTPSTVPLQATQPAGVNIAPITGTSTSLLLSGMSGAFLADSSTNGFVSVGASFPITPVWDQLSPFATGLGFKNRIYRWTSSGSITF